MSNTIQIKQTEVPVKDLEYLVKWLLKLEKENETLGTESSIGRAGGLEIARIAIEGLLRIQTIRGARP